jgi:hypothetical protein
MTLSHAANAAPKSTVVILSKSRRSGASNDLRLFFALCQGMSFSHAANAAPKSSVIILSKSPQRRVE